MNDIKGIIKDVEKSNLVSNKVIKKVIEIIGQEEWNDIYDEEDDICTTTGELIITLKGIADLEKENEELKEFRQDCVKLMEDNVVMARQRAETAKQLTKAKEIIKQFLLWENNWHSKTESKYGLLNGAEQFLKEVEDD